jgi:hypothetical protein
MGAGMETPVSPGGPWKRNASLKIIAEGGRYISHFQLRNMTSSENSPLLQALSAHQVKASVVDFDHYRVFGGLSVETDFIISVLPSEKAGEAFESFK